MIKNEIVDKVSRNFNLAETPTTLDFFSEKAGFNIFFKEDSYVILGQRKFLELPDNVFLKGINVKHSTLSIDLDERHYQLIDRNCIVWRLDGNYKITYHFQYKNPEYQDRTDSFIHDFSSLLTSYNVRIYAEDSEIHVNFLDDKLSCAVNFRLDGTRLEKC